ncbi:succinylglutamate desuccinylase/aspartoacylase family protein [Salinarchaeum sp. IM2453]|uniref:succinylglutamate desuccinylase/aspartoacylase family protein n=1 Tax=Salinarchaeum sp. IM2453 TaxID=2862870 RepID=UPI001C831AF2|nr:succinylglutamate desuccinylase/aspartoacylase family protein [Salinarchaeum sp. IM2453]QZA87646.1 succinylglutamate desuccinylase/aspartoacylase family protein [Salinarchaeum sp. IM2453]
MTSHEAKQVTLATLPSGVDVTTTIHTYIGDTTGPTVYVQAGQHGREINGVDVLRRLHHQLTSKSLRGTVVAVPLANPLTFDHQSYIVPEPLDRINPNMNRVWPGDERGGIHQRMAAALWDHIESADAVVDLHTGSPSTAPHVVYTAGDSQSKELAKAFGTDLLLAEPVPDDGDDEWKYRGFDRKLRIAALDAGIPAITPELGVSRQLVNATVELGVSGVTNILRHLDLLSDDPAVPTEQTIRANVDGRVYADHPGLFVLTGDVQVGEHVEANIELGKIVDPTTYEVLETVCTDTDGILYSLTRESIVAGGNQLAAVASSSPDRYLNK